MFYFITFASIVYEKNMIFFSSVVGNVSSKNANLGAGNPKFCGNFKLVLKLWGILICLKFAAVCLKIATACFQRLNPRRMPLIVFSCQIAKNTVN